MTPLAADRPIAPPASEMKWHLRFLELAACTARWSKDPSRGVGCVIVDDRRQVCSTGFNGLPRGIEDRPDRYERPTKYELVCHAEMNAIIQCARNGVSPVGATLYSTFSPCVHCALAIIQAGVARVVTWESDEAGDAHWRESLAKSIALFREAGIVYLPLSTGAGGA